MRSRTDATSRIGKVTVVRTAPIRETLLREIPLINVLIMSVNLTKAHPPVSIIFMVSHSVKCHSFITYSKRSANKKQIILISYVPVRGVSVAGLNYRQDLLKQEYPVFWLPPISQKNAGESAEGVSVVRGVRLQRWSAGEGRCGQWSPVGQVMQ